MAVHRIRDRATFARLGREGLRVRSGPLTVVWVGDPEGRPPRVAYAIGRKVGGAVVRNRVRRRLREIVAALAPPPGAYLIRVGPAAAELTTGELRTHVNHALAALTARRSARGQAEGRR